MLLLSPRGRAAGTGASAAALQDRAQHGAGVPSLPCGILVPAQIPSLNINVVSSWNIKTDIFFSCQANFL